MPQNGQKHSLTYMCHVVTPCQVAWFWGEFWIYGDLKTEVLMKCFQIAHGSLTKADIQWKLRGNHILKFHKNLEKMWDVKKVMFYCDTKFQVQKHYEMWAMKNTNSAMNSDITILHYSTLILSFSYLTSLNVFQLEILCANKTSSS